MATWHQQRRPVQLFHQTLWTVVVDPPNATRGLMLFETEQQARTYAQRVGYSYVLPPSQDQNGFGNPSR